MLLAQTAPIQVYHYVDIAGKAGYSRNIFFELGFMIDGGHNGFTAWRHDLTYQQAMAKNQEAD